ncbi:hypothetical protein HC766_08245 [Candidatus Gracilibacteria bacterium]|nr:hypothetical protein [Candidatus Gracilibacteria bacterium]
MRTVTGIDSEIDSIATAVTITLPQVLWNDNHCRYFTPALLLAAII